MDFSIIDQLRACIPCSRKPDVDSDDDLEAGPSGRPELDRLLFDSEHDATDVEADAMSLHSSVGLPSRPRKKSSKRKPPRKSIRIFGYDLFGRPQIAEPSPPQSEDESSALIPSPAPSGSARPRTISGNSVDADAAPLGDQTIANLSTSRPNAEGASRWAAPLTDEQIALEEAQQREKEERKARRAARRLRKQRQRDAEAEAAAELAAGFGHDNAGSAPVEEPEFEGFPGGNAVLAQDAAPLTMLHEQKDDERDYGPFVQGEQVSPSTAQAHGEEDDDDDEEDFDVGGEYNRRSKGSGYSPRNSQSGSRSGWGSSSTKSYSKQSHSSSARDSSSYAARRASRSLQAQHLQRRLPQDVPLPPSSAGSNQDHWEAHHIQNSRASNQFPSVASQSQKSLHARQNSRSSAARSYGSSSHSNASFRSPPPESPHHSVPYGSQQVWPTQTGIKAPPSGLSEASSELNRSTTSSATLVSNGFPSTGFGSRAKKSPLLDGRSGSYVNSF